MVPCLVVLKGKQQESSALWTASQLKMNRARLSPSKAPELAGRLPSGGWLDSVPENVTSKKGGSKWLDLRIWE